MQAWVSMPTCPSEPQHKKAFSANPVIPSSGAEAINQQQIIPRRYLMSFNNTPDSQENQPNFASRRIFGRWRVQLEYSLKNRLDTNTRRYTLTTADHDQSRRDRIAAPAPGSQMNRALQGRNSCRSASCGLTGLCVVSHRRPRIGSPIIQQATGRVILWDYARLLRRIIARAPMARRLIVAGSGVTS